VTGIDLTQGFVDVAQSLTKRVNLDGLAEFQQGSALQMPFPAETFDGGYMIHVGMNVANKLGIFREVRRVLKSGGLFTVFDMVRAADGAIRFPVPWAISEESSFVAGVKDYREELQGAGFRVEKERGRLAFSIEFTERFMARMAQSGPPALGLHLLMGEQAPLMARNMLAMMKEGILEPVELFARAV
jgi:ubiquinone/menaquinone biosynthesis C-methylase UbiE